MALTDLTRMEAIKPPKDGGHYADDPQLLARANAWLNGASSLIEKLVGYSFAAALDTVLLNGRGSRMLPVPRPPIISVVSLVVCGVPWSVIEAGNSELSQAAMVEPEFRCHLIGRFQPFPKGFGNVALSAYCGYGTVDLTATPPTVTAVIPEEVQNAVALFAAVGTLEASFAGFGGETLGPEHINNLARNKKDYDSIMDVVKYYSQKAWL